MPLTMITASQAGTRVANSAAFKNAVEFLDARIKTNADLGLTTYTYDKQAHQLSSEKITQLKAFLVENGYTLSEPSNSVILITWSNG